jgi:transposase
MAQISGLARSTIYSGLSDLRDKVSAPLQRIRKKGGGRKKKTVEDPTLEADLRKLIEPATRGDPTQPLLWTSLSLRNLVNKLAKTGHNVSPTVVGNLLRGLGYSLQANRKVREGGQHIDRDAQFRYINKQAKAFPDRARTSRVSGHKKEGDHGQFAYMISAGMPVRHVARI